MMIFDKPSYRQPDNHIHEMETNEPQMFLVLWGRNAVSEVDIKSNGIFEINFIRLFS